MTPETAQIVLIHQDQPKMASLYRALVSRDFRVQLMSLETDILSKPAQIDLLIIDLAVTKNPKASQFIRAPRILVLADEGETVELPPWFQAGHIVLRRYPAEAADLVYRLADYLSPGLSDFKPESHTYQDLVLLFSITQQLSGRLDFDDLLVQILELAPALEAEFAALLLIENDDTIHYRSTQPGLEVLTSSARRKLAHQLIKDGVEGWSMRHDQPAIIRDCREDARCLQIPQLADETWAIVALPIHLKRLGVKGAYLLCHRQPNHFSQAQLPLFEAAMTQINLALENALLFKNETKHATQLALINEVSQAATSILNLEVMLRTVVHAIRRSFSFYNVAIYLNDHRLEEVVLHAQALSDQYGSTLREQSSGPTSFRLGQGLVGRAAALRETMLANDVTRDPRHTPVEGNEQIRSELCVPIVMSTKTIGVLDLHSTQVETFDTYQISAFETLADQLAIAIENARLYDQINQHIQELRSLNQIGQAVASSLDLTKTLTLITRQAINLMGAEAASVALYDKLQDDVWFAAASGQGSQSVIGIRMARGQGIAGWVTEHGESVIVADVKADQRFFGGIDQQSGFTTRSILCVPLQTKGYNIGALEVMNKKKGTFDKDDLALLQALATPAATAIENAQLYEEKTKTIKRLAETQNQLVQSAKLAAVGELAAGVAHEINNPLTTIIGLTYLLLETPLEAAAKKDLEMVSNEAMRARDIVRRLLDFARADVPNREPVDFNELVEEALLLVFTKSISRQIELFKNLNPLPKIYLDANQVKQVIVNLLNNATQAILDNPSQPPRLVIDTNLTIDSNGPQKHDLHGTQEFVTCTIRDSGGGINPEHLDKIFDPFFTTKEVGQGTGLGLSISYGIVEQHGGTITVDSTSKEGTTFTISLPAIKKIKSEFSDFEDLLGPELI